MKVILLKDVYSTNGWRREGEIIDLEGKELRHYLAVGIAAEYEAKTEAKEEKVEVETKEAKAPRKRNTKKAK